MAKRLWVLAFYKTPEHRETEKSEYNKPLEITLYQTIKKRVKRKARDREKLT